MNPDQAAEFLAVSKRTLMDSYKRWGVPHIKVGKHVRFPTDAVAKWVDGKLPPVRGS
ncbi:excisionase family DNA-binding protein [Streptomyces pseudogriseolus]|uniref:excisionase family DNA-binding protein n=1 Tax=Streptomyces pseudogriseolus TaxID=36817 RepID=UPI003FA1B8BF